MIRKLVVWSVVVLFASGYTACKKTELIVETPKSEEQADTRTAADATAEQRTRSEVLAIATQLARGDSKGKTRAVPNFDVEYVLTSAVQKERFMAIGLTPVDTILYILNERDGSGFSLISGDKRISELLAYSDEGHLDIRYVDNLGLAIFLSRLPIFFEQELMKSDRVKREHFKEVPKEPPTVKYTDWKTTYRTLNAVPVCWEQDSPFNNDAPIREGKRAKAGCAATAVAQLLAAHKFPTAWYNSPPIDWTFLTREKYSYRYHDADRIRFEKEIAPLFLRIGNALKNDWGAYGTGAKSERIPIILREMGYKTPSKLTPFKSSEVYYDLYHGNPIIMRGYEEEYTKGWWFIKWKEHRGGHVWLSDGYLQQERTRSVVSQDGEVLSSEVEYRHLLHCNWGWGNSTNGYFLPGVFDSHNPIEPDLNNITTGKTPGYFQYVVEQLIDVHP